MELKQKRYELHGHTLVFTYNDAGVGMITLDCMDLLVDMAKNAPKRGEWVPFEYGDDTWHKCSVCGTADKYIDKVPRPDGTIGTLIAVRNFCPNCGADMRGKDDEYIHRCQ